jgi:hypothetical protein
MTFPGCEQIVERMTKTNSIVLAALFLFLVAVTGAHTQGLQDTTCFPKCRAGYVCHQGTCVSKCNPPCGAGLGCTESGECVEDSASKGSSLENSANPKSSSIEQNAAAEHTSKELSKQIARFSRIRTWGAVTLWGGCGLFVGGIGLAAYKARSPADTAFDQNPPQQNNNATNNSTRIRTVGTVVAAIGAIVAPAGIPLIIIGRKKCREYQGKTAGRVMLRPTAGGLALDYGF